MYYYYVCCVVCCVVCAVLCVLCCVVCGVCCALGMGWGLQIGAELTEVLLILSSDSAVDAFKSRAQVLITVLSFVFFDSVIVSIILIHTIY